MLYDTLAESDRYPRSDRYFFFKKIKNLKLVLFFLNVLHLYEVMCIIYLCVYYTQNNHYIKNKYYENT
jgi:hypothetical protein